MNCPDKLANNDPTRREFLKTTSKLVIGAAVTAVIARPGYTAEDNTIKVALIGCGGRGTGAVANALATRSGPIKLVAMADVFEERLNRSHDALKSAATRTEGSADLWLGGFQAAQVDVAPERRFLGFDAYQKAMDCLKPGDVAVLTTPAAFRWVHFTYAIAKGINVFMEKPISVDGPSTRKMLQLAQDAARCSMRCDTLCQTSPVLRGGVWKAAAQSPTPVRMKVIRAILSSSPNLSRPKPAAPVLYQQM